MHRCAHVYQICTLISLRTDKVHSALQVPLVTRPSAFPPVYNQNRFRQTRPSPHFIMDCKRINVPYIHKLAANLLEECTYPHSWRLRDCTTATSEITAVGCNQNIWTLSTPVMWIYNEQGSTYELGLHGNGREYPNILDSMGAAMSVPVFLSVTHIHIVLAVASI